MIFFFDFFQNFTLKLWILPTAGNPYFATLFKEGEAPSTYSTYAEALQKVRSVNYSKRKYISAVS